MLFHNIGDYLSPFFLLESFQLRYDKVHSTKRPHIILIRDDPIETHKVKHHEPITEK